MEQFEIPKSLFWNRIYRKLADYFNKKVRETENLVINPISVKLPTAHCMVIKFHIVNKNEKYEIVRQGDWKKWYPELTNNPDKIPSDMNIEMAIRHNISVAYKIV